MKYVRAIIHILINAVGFCVVLYSVVLCECVYCVPSVMCCVCCFFCMMVVHCMLLIVLTVEISQSIHMMLMYFDRLGWKYLQIARVIDIMVVPLMIDMLREG